MLNPKLGPGQTIAVIAPASPIPLDRLEAGMDVLREWGFVVVEGKHLRDVHPSLPYLAGTDHARAADLRWALNSPDVDAVIAGRGGYGVHRILPHLGELPSTPKPVIGFSDLTPLLHLLAAHGWPAIHGPLVTSLGSGDDESRTHLHQLLTRPAGPELWSGMRPVVPGAARGGLTGGNLTLLEASSDQLTPAMGAIVVLEDVSEHPFRLDRTLTALIRRGWFDDAAAVVLGDFTDCGDPSVVNELVQDRLGRLGCPVWAGAPVGHGARNVAFPLGLDAQICENGTLRLVED